MTRQPVIRENYRTESGNYAYKSLSEAYRALARENRRRAVAAERELAQVPKALRVVCRIVCRLVRGK